MTLPLCLNYINKKALLDNSFYTDSSLSLRVHDSERGNLFRDAGLFAGRMSGAPATVFSFLFPKFLMLTFINSNAFII
jgi:hypothetical protein